jgi:hypothetical protein
MKTLEFTRSLTMVVRELKVAELVAMVGQWLIGPTPIPIGGPNKTQFAATMLDSHAGYEQLSKIEGTNKILAGLGAPELYEPSRLMRMLTAVQNANESSLLRNNQDFLSFFEVLKSLQNLEMTCTKLLEHEKVGTVQSTEGIVQLELADYDGKGIEPERLRVLVTTLRDLHTNLSRLLGVKGDALRFKYFDSGSSVLLGIQCGKELAKTISDLLKTWWDKLKFSDFDTLDKKIDAVERAVAMSEKMKAAIDNGAVNEEEGKILTHRIFQDVNVLVGIGVTPPLEDEVTVDQRALILAKRDVKLLQSGDEPKAENEGEQSGQR